MKVNLINNMFYPHFEKVKLPALVEAEEDDVGFTILGSELIRIGVEADYYDENYPYYFYPEECEVVE